MSLSFSQFDISLGAVVIRVWSELPLQITDSIQPFCVNGKKPNVTITVCRMRDPIQMPSVPCGDDLLLNYYDDGSRLYAEAKPGTRGPLMVTVYTPDFDEATVYVNEAEHPGVVRTVEKVLQLFPIRRLLSKFNAMVVHASQIAVGDKGILFTAPSGTGKSTQARLWNRYEQARIICNDRTMLWNNGTSFDTYGYPIDGSTPIYCNSKLELGAIVVLRQGSENQLCHLPVLKAMKYLMEQTVFDVWSKAELGSISQQWTDILNRYPVYLLTCRADQDAVICLKKQLQRDGVI